MAGSTLGGAALLVAALLLIGGCDGDPAPTDAGEDVVSCDPSAVACRAAPPDCPTGFAPSVEGTCWGPCVANAECARPIACDPAGSGGCPASWGCGGEGECLPPR